MGEHDVVVAGAGMAGLVTAASLALEGRRILLLEKGPDVGGSMRMSGGSLWTASSMASMEQYVPGGDRALQRQVVEGLPVAVEWLEGLGVPTEGLARDERWFGGQIDVELLSRRLTAIVTDAGGDVARDTALEGTDVDAEGAVTGVRVRSGGDEDTVEASSVVLATGGFQGSGELRARYIPRWPGELALRSNTQSDGAALEAALAVGAATSEGMDGFYGHTMPDIPLEPAQWTAVTAYHSQDTVIVDVSGRRFFDESTSMADEHAPMAIVRRPGALAVMILDDVLYRGEAIEDRSTLVARAKPSFDDAVAFGAQAVIAQTWEAVADGLTSIGLDREAFLRTITDYNAAMRSGTDEGLDAPRSRHRVPLDVAPFRAVVVRPGITFTLGGVRIDTSMRVLREDGRPIPGLLAAGADAGGTYGAGYMGGLALGLVQGRIAAATIANG